MKQRPEADPMSWGFYGLLAAFAMMIAAAFIGYEMKTPSPLAGGFFMGWLAAHGWNWSGRVNGRRER